MSLHVNSWSWLTADSRRNRSFERASQNNKARQARAPLHPLEPLEQRTLFAGASMVSITPALSMPEFNGPDPTKVEFVVSLSEPMAQSFTVQYHTADDTSVDPSKRATAGSDYTAVANGSVTFEPGQTAARISIDVTGDTTPEMNEQFKVVLTGASNNVMIGNAEGIATIMDDDIAPDDPLGSMLANKGSSEVSDAILKNFRIIRTQLETIAGNLGDLPIIGDQVMEGVQPFIDTIADLEAKLSNKLDAVYSDLDQSGLGTATDVLIGAIREGIFSVFGPSGLNILNDGPDPGNQIDRTDVVVTFETDDSNNKSVQFDFHLGQVVFYDLAFEFGHSLDDLLPFLDLRVDASDGIRFQASWDVYFGFGYTTAGGGGLGQFYINTEPTDIHGFDVKEVEVAADVFAAPPQDAAGNDIITNEPGINADASLGLMHTHLEDGTAKRITLTAQQGINFNILGPNDFSLASPAQLIVYFDNDLKNPNNAPTPLRFNLPYRSPAGGEGYTQFLLNLQAAVDEAVHTSTDALGNPNPIAAELLPISIRPNLSNINTVENPDLPSTPSIEFNARTPAIVGMSIEGDNIHEWGFNPMFQTDDDRSMAFGFTTGQTSSISGGKQVLLGTFAIPTAISEDVDFQLDYGSTMAMVKLRAGSVEEGEEVETTITDAIKFGLSQAGVPQAELDLIEITFPDLTTGPEAGHMRVRIAAPANRALKVTYDLKDRTNVRLSFAIDLKDPGTLADDGRLSFLELAGAIGDIAANLPDTQDEESQPVNQTNQTDKKKDEADTQEPFDPSELIGSITDIFVPQFEARAELRLHVTSDMDAITGALEQAFGLSGGTLGLPQLAWDLKLDIAGGIDPSDDDFNIKKPVKTGLESLRFDNVMLDPRELLSSILEPVANVVGGALGPVADVLGDGVDAAQGFINAPIPLISDLVDGDVSILDLTPNGDQINNFLSQIGGLFKLAGSLSDFLANYDGRPISFGCFEFDQVTRLVLPCEVTDTLNEASMLSSESFLSAFASVSASAGGLKLELLSPESIINMMIGEPFDIVSFSLPALDAKLGLGFNFGFGDLGVKFNVGADIHVNLRLAYDSTGIERIIDAFSAGTDPDWSDLLDGFYIASEKGAEVSVGIEAGGGARISIPGFFIFDPLFAAELRLTVGGSVGLDLLDPVEDGKLRFDEVTLITNNFAHPENLLCLFDIPITAKFDFYASMTILGLELSTEDLPFPTAFEFSISAQDIFMALGFDCSEVVAPVVAQSVEESNQKILRVNAGAFDTARIFRDIDDSDGVTVTLTESGGKFIVTILDQNGNALTPADKPETKEFAGPFDKILIVGGDGNDKFDLSALTSTIPVEIRGGDGNDTIMAGAGPTTIFGGNGNDLLIGGTGNDVIRGEDGDDTITGGGGKDQAFGGSGNDVIRSAGSTTDTVGDFLSGDTGNDTVTGGDGNDQIFGGMGNDSLLGGKGNDRILGDSGNDTVLGGEGADAIFGNAGDDLLFGGTEDSLLAGDGNDTVFGGAGIDRIFGGPANDRLYGDDGDDFVQGDGGADLLYGNLGQDIIVAGLGDAWVDGGAGTDALSFDLVNNTNGVTATLKLDRLVGQAGTGANLIGSPQTTPIMGFEELGRATFGSTVDRFTVENAIDPFNVYLGGGDDTIVVKGGPGLNLDSEGGTGDTLEVDLRGNTTPVMGFMGPQIITGLGIGEVRFLATENILVNLGRGDDVLTVDPTIFNAGSGARIDLAPNGGAGASNKIAFPQEVDLFGVNTTMKLELPGRTDGINGTGLFNITAINKVSNQITVSPTPALPRGLNDWIIRDAPKRIDGGSPNSIRVNGNSGDDLVNFEIDDPAALPDEAFTNFNLFVETARIDNTGGFAAETWAHEGSAGLREIFVTPAGQSRKRVVTVMNVLKTVFDSDAGSADVLQVTDQAEGVKFFSMDGDSLIVDAGQNLLQRTDFVNSAGATFDAVAASTGGDVYAVNSSLDRLYHFRRTTSTGSLSLITTFTDANNGADGLDGASSVTISPDGLSVYVTGANENKIAIFSRNPTSGNLSFGEVVPALDGVRRFAISGTAANPSGGDNLGVQETYAIGSSIDFFQALSRNASGTLADIGTFGPIELVGPTPRAVATSAEGRVFFIAGNNGIAQLGRNDQGGFFTFGVLPAKAPSILRITPDGARLIAASDTNGVITVYDIEDSGVLTFAGEIDGIPGLDAVSDVAFSPDGMYLAATSATDSAIVLFRRNNSTAAGYTFVQRVLGEAMINLMNRPLTVLPRTTALGRVLPEFVVATAATVNPGGLASYVPLADGTPYTRDASSPPTILSVASPIAIGDNNAANPTNSHIAFSGIIGMIADIDVYVDIDHTTMSQLELTLISPEGTRVTLANMQGGTGDGYSAVAFDDQAATSVSGASANPKIAGRFRPQDADGLAQLIGEDPNGEWTLEIKDKTAGTSGVLNDWFINVVADVSAHDVPQEVPPAPFVTSTIDVTGMPIGVADVNVTLNINHPSVEDLSVVLISPWGLEREIVSPGAASGANFSNTTLDDLGGQPLFSGTAPYVGTFGVGALNNFEDFARDPNGTWTLKVVDTQVDADVDFEGTLVDWSIQIASPPQSQQSFEAVGVPTTIPDGGNVPFNESIIHVAESGEISDLDVFFNITHDQISDLEAYLVSPMGTEVQLFIDLTMPGSFVFPAVLPVFSTTLTSDSSIVHDFALDDEAATGLAFATSPVNGDFAPGFFNRLSAFDGENPQGDWTLKIRDRFQGEVGTVNEWGLDFQLQPATEIMSGDTPTTLNDPTVTEIPVVLSGLTGSVDQVVVGLDLTHARISDLTAYLVSPSGTMVELFSHIGGPSSPTHQIDLGAAGTVSIADAPLPITLGTLFIPEGDLTVLEGENPNGTWTLMINDTVPGETGEVNFFGITVDTTTAAQAQQDVSPNTPIAEVPFQELTVDVPAGITVQDLLVQMSITHAEFGDLEAFLRSPLGTTVELFTHVGPDMPSAPNMHVLGLVDYADEPLASATVPYTSLYQPESPLSAFNGQDAQGTWTLMIRDTVPGEAGEITSLHLVFGPADSTPLLVSSDTPGVIDEPQPGPTIDIPIVVSGVIGQVADAVVLLDILHAKFADLEAYLISPMGTTVELFTNVGSDFQIEDAVNAIDLADDANESIADASNPYDGVFRPEGMLSDFAGEDPNGTWLLRITDAVPFVEGTVEFFELDLDISNTMTFTTLDTDKPIPDAIVTTSTIDVQGAGGRRIADVNVTLDLDYDAAPNLLEVYLVSAMGTRVKLTPDFSSESFVFGESSSPLLSSPTDYERTTFDDEGFRKNADLGIQQLSPFTGVFRPLDALNLLDGERAGGMWTLEIYNDSQLFGGTLNGWWLTIALEEPDRYEVEHHELTALTVTSNGNSPDAFTIQNNDVPTLTLNLGEADDRTIVSKQGDGNIVANLGAGDDFFDLIEPKSGSGVIVNAGAGDDILRAWQVEDMGATTQFNGEGDNDTFQVVLKSIAPGAVLNVNGGTGVNMLRYDDQSAPANIATIGQIKVNNTTVVAYSNIMQPLKTFMAPLVEITSEGMMVADGVPVTISEGDSLSLGATVTPPPSANVTSVGWDLDGDGQFGDRSGTDITLSWAELSALGLDDGPMDYPVKIRVKTDTDEFAFDTITLHIDNTRATPMLIGDDSVDEHVSYALTLSSIDFGNDVMTQWQIDWGDGSPIETFMASAVNTTHVFDVPDMMPLQPSMDYTIVVTAVDEDGETYGAPGEPQLSKTVTVNNTPAKYRQFGGETTIEEGSNYSLNLLAFVDLNFNGRFDAGETDPNPPSYIINWGDGSLTGSIASPVSGTTFNHPMTDSAVTGPYTDNGQFQISVMVVEPDGSFVEARPFDEVVSDGGTFELNVVNIAPRVTAKLQTLNGGAVTQINEGSTIRLLVAHSDPGNDNLSTWTIDWGDGVVEMIPAETVAANSNIITHTYMDDHHVFQRDENRSFVLDADGQRLIVSNDPFKITASVADEDGAYSVAFVGQGDPVFQTYNFDNGSLQGWTTLFTSPGLTDDDLVDLNNPLTQVLTTFAPVGLEIPNTQIAAADTGDYRVATVEIKNQVASAENLTSAHEKLLIRSPEFLLGAGGDLTLMVTGGRGAGTNAGTLPTAPGLLADSTSAATGSKVIGIGLRDTSNNTYVLTKQRSVADNQYEQVTFSAAELTPFVKDNVRYTIDVFDAFAGASGFIAFDSVSIPTPATSTMITVNNVNPTLTLTDIDQPGTSSPTINEGSEFRLRLSSTDPGKDTITRWIVDWGDGQVQQVPSPGGQSPLVFHTYTNDRVAPFVISAAAFDEDGMYMANAAMNVKVNDVAPTPTSRITQAVYGPSPDAMMLTALSSGNPDSVGFDLDITGPRSSLAGLLDISTGAAGSDRALEGQEVTLELKASDPGFDRVKEWTVDWGDGTPVQTLPIDADHDVRLQISDSFVQLVADGKTKASFDFRQLLDQIDVRNAQNVVTTLNPAQFGLAVDGSVVTFDSLLVTATDGDASSQTLLDESFDTLPNGFTFVGGAWNITNATPPTVDGPVQSTVLQAEGNGGLSVLTFPINDAGSPLPTVTPVLLEVAALRQPTETVQTYEIDWDGDDVVDQTVDGNAASLAIAHIFSDHAASRTIKVTLTHNGSPDRTVQIAALSANRSTATLQEQHAGVPTAQHSIALPLLNDASTRWQVDWGDGTTSTFGDPVPTYQYPAMFGIAPPTSGAQSDAQLAKLTDGALGTANANDGNWVRLTDDDGQVSPAPLVDFDFGSVVSLETLTLNLLVDQGTNVGPQRLRVLFSGDGKNFSSTIAPITTFGNLGDGSVRSVSVNFGGQNARYVRLDFSTMAAGTPNAVLLGEVGFTTNEDVTLVNGQIQATHGYVAEGQHEIVAKVVRPNATQSTDTPRSVHTVTSELNVANVTGVLTDVNLTLNIDHTFDSDLEAFLVSPAGQRVRLFSHVDGSGDNFTNTVFDDGDPNVTGDHPSITGGAAPFTGTFEPVELLSAFNGEDPNGTWMLEITDNVAGDIGRLKNWSLDLQTTTENPTPITKTHVAPALAINAMTTSTINVHGLAGRVRDINVSLDLMQDGALQAFNHDVTLTLVSPGGTSVQIANFSPLIGGDLVNFTLDDEAVATLQNGLAMYKGAFKPGNALSAFDGVSGANLNGDWKLIVADNGRGQSTVLTDWSLDITTGVTASNVQAKAVTFNQVSTNPLEFEPVESTLIVLGPAGTSASDHVEIADLDVTVKLTHGRPEDLDVYLISPQGTRVELFTDVGDTTSISGQTLRFDDDADQDILQTTSGGDAPSFTASFRAERFLSLFNGEDPRGTWTLQVFDDTAGVDGTLDNWSLSIATEQAPTDLPASLNPYHEETVVVGREGLEMQVETTVGFRRPDGSLPGVDDNPAAFIVFDGVDAVTFKYAGVRDNGVHRTWFIGHHDASGFHDDATFSEEIVQTLTHVYTDGNLLQRTVAAGHIDGSLPKATVNGQTVESTLLIKDPVSNEQVDSRALTGQILDVDVSVDLLHPDISQLRLVLVHQESGKSVELVAANDTMGTGYAALTFDSQTVPSIEGAKILSQTGRPQILTGRFRPASSLDAFNGDSPNGTWKLQVTDATDGGNLTGVLSDWRLTITTKDPNNPEPDSVRVIKTTVTANNAALSQFAAPDLELTVLNRAPTIMISGEDGVKAGDPFMLSLIGPALDPGDDTITEVRIYWGDGTEQMPFESITGSTLADIIGGDTVEIAHTYANIAKTYNVRVTIVDEDGEHPVLQSVRTTVGVVNGAFKPGGTFPRGWTATGPVMPMPDPTPPDFPELPPDSPDVPTHARLTKTSSISQTLLVPDNAVALEFSILGGMLGSSPQDHFDVKLTNPSNGQPVINLPGSDALLTLRGGAAPQLATGVAYVGEGNGDLGRNETVDIDVIALRGQEVTITFMTTDMAPEDAFIDIDNVHFVQATSGNAPMPRHPNPDPMPVPRGRPVKIPGVKMVMDPDDMDGDDEDDGGGTIDRNCFMIVTGPKQGTATIDPRTGVITVLLNQNATEMDMIEIAVCDTDGNPSGPIPIPLVPQSDGGAATDDMYETDEDTPLQRNAAQGVLANDTPGNNRVVTVSGAPEHGDVTLATDGSFTYTPEMDFNGTDTFTYLLTIDGGSASVGTVTVTVNPVPDAPRGNTPVTLPAGANAPTLIDVPSLYTDPESDIDPTKVMIVTNPQHGGVTVDPVTGQVTYTPTNGFTGSDSVVVNVRDLAGNTSNNVTVMLDVGSAQIGVQSVAGTASNTQLLSFTPFHIDVDYTTLPLDETLSGLGLRIHFNSSQLNFDGLTGLLGTNLVSQDTEPKVDTGNFDNDASTDRFIEVVWNDAAGNWPGAGTLPERLFTANFVTSPTYNGTTVRFSASQKASNYGFASNAVPLGVGTVLPTDVDLVVSQTESVDPAFTGEGAVPLQYIVTVENQGPANTTSVQLMELLTLPTGVTIDMITASGGTSFNQNSMTWLVGGLPAGESRTLTIDLTVGENAASGTNVIRSTAIVTGADQQLIRPANDFATQATSITNTPPRELVALLGTLGGSGGSVSTKAGVADTFNNFFEFGIKGPGLARIFREQSGRLSVEFEQTTAKTKFTIKNKNKFSDGIMDRVDSISGELASFSAKGISFLGDIIFPGYVGAFTAADVADQHLIEFGGSALAKPIKLTFEKFTDVTLTSLSPLQLTLTDWQDTDPKVNPDSLTAPWVKSLTVKGDKKKANRPGTWSANLVLSGESAPKGDALGTLKANAFGSDLVFDINGNAKSIDVKSAIDGLSMDVQAVLKSLKFLGGTNVTVIAGEFGSISSTGSWLGGGVTAALGKSIDVKANKKAVGDLAAGHLKDATITLSGIPAGNKAKQVISSLKAAGDVNNVDLNLADSVGSVDFSKAGVDDLSVNATADIKSIKLGDTGAATVHGASIGAVQAARWLTGEVVARDLKSIKTTGNKKTGVPGDLAIDMHINESSTSQAKAALGSASVAANLSGNWTIKGPVGSLTAGNVAGDFHGDFAGDVKGFASKAGFVDSSIFAQILGKFDVKLNVQDSLIIAGGPNGATGGHSIGALKVGGSFTGSRVLVGIDPVDGNFDNGNDVRLAGASQFIKALQIDGVATGDGIFVAGLFPTSVKINGVSFDPTLTNDPRFDQTA